jgi:hypothetical protein
MGPKPDSGASVNDRPRRSPPAAAGRRHRPGSFSLVVALVSAACCLGGVLLTTRLGDYTTDAGPAVRALAAGRFGQAAAVPFMMGPFSIVLRAPFAWAAGQLGAGELWSYRAGILPCLAAAALLGLVLVRRSRSHGWTGSWLFVVAVLAVLSPASLAAAQNGHPEELLAGVFCVAAVLLALDARWAWAGIALGLAVATKQWALLAVIPTLLAAAPGSRLRLTLVGTATAALVYVPFVARDPGAFMAATRSEAHVVSAATPETVWLLASHEKTVRLHGFPTLTYHEVAHWVPPVSHSLIILAALPLGLLLWRRSGRGADPVALLALLFLLRCVLDPVDQGYFHAPFLLALLAWEVSGGKLRMGGLPAATVAAAACLALTFDALQARGFDPWQIDGLYLAWTGAVGWYLLSELRLVPRPAFTAHPPASLRYTETPHRGA